MISPFESLPKWRMYNPELSLIIQMPAVDKQTARSNLKIILKEFNNDAWMCIGTEDENKKTQRNCVVEQVLVWLKVPYQTISVDTIDIHEDVPVPQDLLSFLSSMGYTVERFR